MNKFIGIGNIATEIDLRYTKNGNAVSAFNLAINERDEAVFIPIEAWKKTAENVANYCGKGSKVSVEGSIKIDKWEKDGQKRSRTKVLAFSVEFLDKKGEGQSQQQPKQDNQTFKSEAEEVNINENDLPF